MQRFFIGFTACVLVGTLLFCTNSAHAGFIGSSVSVQYFLPDLSSPFGGPSTAIVGPGVEFDDTTALGEDVAGNVDIGDSTIKISSEDGSEYTSDAFNGEVFTFTGAPVITGVTADASSTFSPADISFTSDTITLNYAGVVDPGGTISLLDVTFASAASGGGSSAPLPSGLSLGLLCLGTLALAVGRRNIQAC